MGSIARRLRRLWLKTFKRGGIFFPTQIFKRSLIGVTVIENLV